jgi:hypothetical protein
VRTVGFHFLPVKPPFRHRNGFWILGRPAEGNSHAVKIALVIKTRCLDKLCVLFFRLRPWRPGKNLREERRSAQLLEIHIHYGS